MVAARIGISSAGNENQAGQQQAITVFASSGFTRGCFLWVPLARNAASLTRRKFELIIREKKAKIVFTTFYYTQLKWHLARAVDTGPFRWYFLI